MRAAIRQIAGLAIAFLVVSSASAADPTYWQDVRPVLRKYCTACHSTRNLKELDVSGGLALDSYEAALKGGKTSVIHVGKSADSPLIASMTTSDTEKRMPLAAPPVPPEAIALLRRWIDCGAKEGTRPTEDTTTTTATTAPRRRKLDVTLTTAAVPPRGLLGPMTPSRLEVSLPAGPLAPVTAVAFSPDGRLLAAGSYGRVTLWDLTTVQPARVLTGVLGAVNDLRFSPDGKLLATAGGQPSAKGDLRLFDVSSGKLVARLDGHQDVVFSVSFRPDGRQLASASFDKTVRVWDVASHRTTLTLSGHSDFVYSVAYSPDGQWLASASKDRTVKITDATTGKSRFTLSGMNDDVLAVAVSADGKNVLSSGNEPGLVWWNTQTGERLRAQGGHGVAVHEIAVSKDGSLIASAGGDRTVRLWQGASGPPLRTISVGSVVYAVAVSPDARRVASGSFDGLVRLWDTATGRPLATLMTVPSAGESADWLAVTPEGYVSRSPGVATTATWKMGGQTVPGPAVWKSLAKSDAVRRAVRGETVPAVTFEK